MIALSRREKIYIGVFVLTLIWGIWNFRGQIGSTEAPRPQKPATATQGPSTATPGTRPAPAGSMIRKGTLPVDTTRFVPPPWGTDPFHRTWRGSGALG